LLPDALALKRTAAKNKPGDAEAIPVRKGKTCDTIPQNPPTQDFASSIPKRPQPPRQIRDSRAPSAARDPSHDRELRAEGPAHLRAPRQPLRWCRPPAADRGREGQREASMRCPRSTRRIPPHSHTTERRITTEITPSLSQPRQTLRNAALTATAADPAATFTVWAVGANAANGQPAYEVVSPNMSPYSYSTGLGGQNGDGTQN